MPEGHSVHRIARQFTANFVGSTAAVSSPQGRFEVGAAELDGRSITSSEAIGKHLLLGFDGSGSAPDRVLHVHLGIYGAWDFAGAISVDPTILASTSAAGAARMGQTGMRVRWVCTPTGEVDVKVIKLPAISTGTDTYS